MCDQVRELWEVDEKLSNFKSIIIIIKRFTNYTVEGVFTEVLTTVTDLKWE